MGGERVISVILHTLNIRFPTEFQDSSGGGGGWVDKLAMQHGLAAVGSRNGHYLVIHVA